MVMHHTPDPGIIFSEAARVAEEIVVIETSFTNPVSKLFTVIADMLAQSEHKLGTSVLITTSKRLVKAVRRIQAKGAIIRVKNLAQGVDLVNQFAPEHVQIMVKRPERIVNQIKNAGAIFLGPYTPTAIGDYLAGPSHVLPTHGSARFFSGLSITDFLKTSHVISYSRKALEKVRGPAEYLANLEGLRRHYESIKVRFED